MYIWAYIWNFCYIFRGRRLGSGVRLLGCLGFEPESGLSLVSLPSLINSSWIHFCITDRPTSDNSSRCLSWLFSGVLDFGVHYQAMLADVSYTKEIPDFHRFFSVTHLLSFTSWVSCVRYYYDRVLILFCLFQYLPSPWQLPHVGCHLRVGHRG